MSRRSKSHFRRRLVLWGLLALLCIGLTELAVCAYADPALFQRITAPASQLFQTVRTAGAGLLDRLTPEEAPVSQLAGDPAISEAPPMEDANLTEVAVRADREILTGGTVALTYYNQGEEPWASRPFGPDPISGYGCGPTALSMLVSSLTDQDINPEEMAAWAYEHGYCAPGSGSYLSIVEGVSQAYGLSAESVPDLSPGELRQDLSSGHIFVALMGSVHFTSSGHFILLRGVTLDGKILVADPNSRERSLAAWDPEVILAELAQCRSYGAPLWRVSTLKLHQAPSAGKMPAEGFFPPNRGLTQLW